MKKLLLVSFFIIFSVSFSFSFSLSKPKPQDIVYLDYSYIVENYSKTQDYNKDLSKAYKKITGDNAELKEDDVKLKEYKEYKEKLTQDIVNDIDLAIAFVGFSEKWSVILNKKECLFVGDESYNVSKKILEFLNSVYKKVLQNENIRKFKQTDVIC